MHTNKTAIKSLAATCIAGQLCALALPVFAAASPPASSAVAEAEPRANTVNIPGQILKSGINLDDRSISPNSAQLADIIHISNALRQLQDTRKKMALSVESHTEDSPQALPTRMALIESKLAVVQKLQRVILEIDFVLAEIEAEQNIYTSMLSNLETMRDKKVAKTNAASFVSNGALWAVCEGLAIPSYKYPGLSVESGINGIVAGVIPSFFSLWAMKQTSGKHMTSEVAPNMLSKIFGYPASGEIDYPDCVWVFLNTVPPHDTTGRTRREQLIDRWVSDKNIPDFTDVDSKSQLDAITASVPVKKGLSISMLSTRTAMLEQLKAEIMKMKRLMLELCMVATGDKQI